MSSELHVITIAARARGYWRPDFRPPTTTGLGIDMFRTLPYRHLVAVLALREQAFNGCHQHFLHRTQHVADLGSSVDD
jgi:hypothetical protein